MALQTPVLLLGFNRPDDMADLINHLRPHSPTRLYLAVDGPRPHVAGEETLVAQTQATRDLVDWDCEIHSLYRDENLGCGRGVSDAISWFFEHEEAGIILEDDIRPGASFFPFASELLDRYADDPRVWAISGCNFVPPEHQEGNASYRFSTVPHIWGWATWRRSWEKYRWDIPNWREDLPLKGLWETVDRSPSGLLFWAGMFTLMAGHRVDTWDFQFVAAAMANGALTATANTNLTENVGFTSESTHTAVRPAYLQEVGTLSMPLVHPADVAVDKQADSWTRSEVLGATPAGLLAQGARFVRGAVQSRAARLRR
jgi:hypothetical protein